MNYSSYFSAPRIVQLSFLIALLIGTCLCQSAIPTCSKEQNDKLQNISTSCVQPIITYGTQVVGELMGTPSKDTLLKLCSHIRDLSSCMFNNIANVGCFDDNMISHMRKTNDAALAGLDYLCDNGAQKALEFFKKRGVGCMMAIGSTIGNCSKKFFAEMDFMKIMTNTEDPQKLFCSWGDPLKKCIINPAKNSQSCDPAIADILSGTIDKVLSSYSCGGGSSETDVKNGENQDGNTSKQDKKEDGDNGGATAVATSLLFLLLPLLLPVM